jgi:hypothetical protein
LSESSLGGSLGAGAGVGCWAASNLNSIAAAKAQRVSNLMASLNIMSH